MTAAAVVATDSDWQIADAELESTQLPPFGHILAVTRIPRQGPGISSAGSPLYPGQPVIYGPLGEMALCAISAGPPGPRPGPGAATVTTPHRVGAAAAVGLHYTTFSRLRVSIYIYVELLLKLPALGATQASQVLCHGP